MSDRAAPYVLAQGQIRSHPGAFPTIKAGAADTGGLLTVDEGVIGPGTPGPPLHIHERQDECLFVIEGHLLVQVGEERHELGPGSFAWMPRQVPHSYANVSGSPVHAIGIVVPGGLEEFFAEQSAYFAQLVASLFTVALVNGGPWLAVGLVGFAVWLVFVVIASISLLRGRQRLR